MNDFSVVSFFRRFALKVANGFRLGCLLLKRRVDTMGEHLGGSWLPKQGSREKSRNRRFSLAGVSEPGSIGNSFDHRLCICT